MLRTARLLVVLGALLCGCRDRAAQETATAAAPAPQPPSSADELLRHVSARAKGLVLTSLTLSYVRPDGVMDPTYGSMQAQIGDLPPPPPPDDPSRPVGAPEPPRYASILGNDCWELAWRPGGMVSENHRRLCGPSLGQSTPHQAVRCSIAQLWERARKDGAPAGLAVISWDSYFELKESLPTTVLGWKFSITDAPRDISFQKQYPDDCDPIVEKAPPARD
ncbi:MAG: hypothetical protein IPI49_05475 [Myxococcales bacterium]|nr:hypothetical protein [Myxococcales bacterium]HRC57767.1 hypothetical protein [Kofleriaceae bacterium]